MKYVLLLLSWLIVFISHTSGLNYVSVIEDTTLTTMGAMKMSMSISDTDDLISISLTGPSYVYFSIGIGSCNMDNSWALIVPGLTASDGTTPFEQLLGSNQGGSTLDSTFQITKDTTSGLLRTVTLTRTLSTIVDDSYYAFNTDDEELIVMWAYGEKADYSNHGEYQRDCTNLEFSKTLQTDHDKVKAGFNWGQLFSTDSLYIFGHSSGSLILVLVLLLMVMIYAAFRCYIKKNKKNKNNKNNKKLQLTFDEMEALITDDTITEKYTAI